MQRPLSAYKQTSVKTASPGRLIVMMYDEGIRQLDIAVRALEENTKTLDKVHNAIIKVQDIITELLISLDLDNGGEIAKNLFSLYTYFNKQLFEANTRKDAQQLKEVRTMLAELRVAWVNAAESSESSKANGGPERGLNIAG